MTKTSEQIEAAITRLMLKNSAQEAALAALASMLNSDQISQLRDRIAALSVLQEIADGPRSTPMAQDLLQPMLDRLHGMMEGAHRRFAR